MIFQFKSLVIALHAAVSSNSGVTGPEWVNVHLYIRMYTGFLHKIVVFFSARGFLAAASAFSMLVFTKFAQKY